MCLVFAKILKANLCFGTNLPWGTFCQLKYDSYRCTSGLNSNLSWCKSQKRPNPLIQHRLIESSLQRTIKSLLEAVCGHCAAHKWECVVWRPDLRKILLVKVSVPSSESRTCVVSALTLCEHNEAMVRQWWLQTRVHSFSLSVLFFFFITFLLPKSLILPILQARTSGLILKVLKHFELTLCYTSASLEKL